MKSSSLRQVIKILEEDSWYLVRIDGSHRHFKHPTKNGLVTVKYPDKEIPIKTFRSIE